jgi:putative transposase
LTLNLLIIKDNGNKGLNAIREIYMAIKDRKSALSLIHHSDEGLQYCSKVYQHVLNVNKIKPSMTDGYDYYQNALAERVNGILKMNF